MRHSTTKLTIEYVKQFIEENYKGSSLISNKYEKIQAPLQIKCENDHFFKRSFYDIKEGYWCSQCKKEKQIIDKNKEIIQILKDKYPNAKLISGYYKYDSKSIKIQCEQGHIFNISFGNLKIGRWCKQCNKPDVTIESINKFVQNKYNGKCLDKEFKSQLNIMHFECEKGHQFKKCWQYVRNGSWCSYHDCAGRFIPNIEFIKNYIKEKYNGICVSDKYVNSDDPIKVRCKNGHEWSTCWNYIRSGNWCAECYGNTKKTLEEINSYVFDKYGGQCTSKEYTNNKTKLQFKCAKGHEWKTTWHTIYSSKCWCPTCNDGFGESFCRFVFEKMFDKKFPKTRPEWLVNNEGNQMELDGHCEELNLAFEYNGRQHEQIVSRFKMTKADLSRRRELDVFKDGKCKEVGVRLVRIPQFNKKFTQFKLVRFLEKQLFELGIDFNEGVDVSEFYCQL